MKWLIIKSIGLIILLVLSGGSCERKTSQEGNEEELTYNSLGELQFKLKDHYAKIEQSLRNDYGVTDQQEINRVMQGLIDAGDVIAPFVLTEDNYGFPVAKEVSYSQFKNISIDSSFLTNEGYTFNIDSLGNIIPKDSSGVDSTAN